MQNGKSWKNHNLQTLNHDAILLLSQPEKTSLETTWIRPDPIFVLSHHLRVDNNIITINEKISFLTN